MRVSFFVSEWSLPQPAAREKLAVEFCEHQPSEHHEAVTPARAHRSILKWNTTLLRAKRFPPRKKITENVSNVSMP